MRECEQHLWLEAAGLRLIDLSIRAEKVNILIGPLLVGSRGLDVRSAGVVLIFRYGLADSFLTGELAEDAVHYRLLNSSSSSPRDDDEAGDVFIFSEGSVVFWNVAKEDTTYFLDLLSKFEVKPYERKLNTSIVPRYHAAPH